MRDAVLRAIGHSRLPGAMSLLSRMGVFQRMVEQDFRIRWNGLSYHGNTRFIVDRYIWFAGAYCPHEIAILSTCLDLARRNHDHVVLLDIGANIGQHSLALHRRANRIIAFEPNPEAAARLRHNAVENSIENIEVHEIALGETDGNGRLGSGLHGNDGSRSLNWTLNDAAYIEVPVRAAEAFIASLSPDVGPIGVVKLDVEGHERQVLTSLRDRFSRDRPFILFELVGNETKGGFGSLESVQSVLYPNHVLFGVETRTRRLAPFDWQRHEMALCAPSGGAAASLLDQRF